MGNVIAVAVATALVAESTFVSPFIDIPTGIAANAVKGKLPASANIGSEPRFGAILEGANVSGVGALTWKSADNLIWGEAFGATNYQYNVPLTLHNRFRVASNSKLFTAVSLYQLQEQGKVNLSRPLSDYLNQTDFEAFGFPNVTTYCPVVRGSTNCTPPTFIELLAMQAGIEEGLGYQFEPYPGSLALVAGRYIMNPLLFVPGTAYYYSNPSFSIAAYFVEKFSGVPLAQYLKENIWDRLGMHNTGLDPYTGKFRFDPYTAEEWYRFIDPESPHGLVSVGKCSAEFQTGSMLGSSGVVSTAEDEAKFYFGLFNLSDDGEFGPTVLFQTVETVIDLIRPRSYMGPYNYYGQGIAVVVNVTSLRDGEPFRIEQVWYQGGTPCTDTMNIFDITRYPPLMAQVFSNSPAFYLNSSNLTAVNAAADVDFFEYTGRLHTPPSIYQVAYKLIEEGMRYVGVRR